MDLQRRKRIYGTMNSDQKAMVESYGAWVIVVSALAGIMVGGAVAIAGFLLGSLS